MIYCELFFAFFYVGCFAFGGAYGAIPLIRETVLRYGWIADEELSYMTAVSESTPGPIMINLATYIGGIQAGFTGAFLATLAVVLPSFIIIIAAYSLLNHYAGNKCFQSAMKGLKPCIAGMILAVGLMLSLKQCRDIRSCEIMILLAVILFYLKVSPIKFIILSAFLGMILS